jgi:hypothetical protein
MFITLQFPLFDYRFIKANPNRTARPDWTEPKKNDRVRYFGEIFDRTKPYLGPYDDEKKYCNARSVINLCGMGDEHFYKSLFTSPFQSRILFRRFQSDGKCMAKFEIGLNDNFEKKIAAQHADPATTAKAVYDHIKKYLLCPVRLKIGNKLSPYVPLADAGNDLKIAYYWATSKGKKSFNSKDIKYEVESCEPVLLIQLDKSKIDLSALDMEKIDIPGLFNQDVQLYYQYIPYRLGRKIYNLKAWIIGTADEYTANPLLPRDFDEYNETIRYLRINLLRIHVEIIMQKKLVEVFSNTNEAFKIKDAATRDRLYFYLHKIWLNLSNIKRNNQPQEKLVETAFRLDESYYGSAGMDEQIKLLEDYKEWLKNLQITPQNEQVRKYVENNTANLQNKQEAGAEETTVFISYTHADESTVVLLKQKLEKENIKVILDSASMQAGTNIDDFITASIKNSNATVSIVSAKSLTSGWVSIETVNTLSFKKFFTDKKFIPCYLDMDFFDNNFVLSAVEALDKKLADIEDLVKKYFEKKIDSRDLDDEKNRLYYLRTNLSGIVQRLKQILCIDMSPANIETNFPALLAAIKN